MSFWNTTVDWITGKERGPAGQGVNFSDVIKSVNWGGVANIAGSYFLNRAFDSGGPDAGGGYQGDIPDYTAVRSRVANTYDPNRRPGSGGQRYFSDMQYVEPYAPTTPEIDQAATDAGTEDTAPSTEGLAALDVVRQIADKQAKFLEEQNVANPAYEAKPAALNINPTGATGIQALQAKNAATAGSGVNSLLPVPQYDDKGNVISMAKGGIARFAVGGRYLGGMTDGMADEVPASIDGKQPAALSDGEFVVPADVVSHLGNGNSNAGAKALHDMMANVRQDRTGNSEQGKEINATNYLPKVG